MLTAQASDVEKIVSLGEVDTFILIETVTRQFEAKRKLLALELSERNAAITVHKILGPDYQLNPSPMNREIENKTRGGVQ
jgi:hypothetical protein